MLGSRQTVGEDGLGSAMTEEDGFGHSSTLPESGSYRSLNEGQRVQFDVVQERGRDRAANVVLL